MSRTKSSANWEQYCLTQLTQVTSTPEAELAAQAQVMGLAASAEGQFIAKFFNRDYLISPQGITASDGEITGPLHQGLLASYFLSKGRAQLQGEYLPINRLTGISGMGDNSPNDKIIAPLATHFGNKYTAFTEAATKIGGQHQGLSQSGGESWLFPDLAFLPVQIIFFEADEEFEAEVKVLFDASAPIFVAYEILELMEMILVGELLNAVGLLGCSH